MEARFSPAITRRQSPPSTLRRLPACAAAECGLWLGASDRETGLHYRKRHEANVIATLRGVLSSRGEDHGCSSRRAWRSALAPGARARASAARRGARPRRRRDLPERPLAPRREVAGALADGARA